MEVAEEAVSCIGEREDLLHSDFYNILNPVEWEIIDLWTDCKSGAILSKKCCL